MHVQCISHLIPALLFLCRTCTFSSPSPTAWSTWTCLGQTAPWTWFVLTVSVTLAIHAYLLNGTQARRETGAASRIRISHHTNPISPQVTQSHSAFLFIIPWEMVKTPRRQWATQQKKRIPSYKLDKWWIIEWMAHRSLCSMQSLSLQRDDLLQCLNRHGAFSLTWFSHHTCTCLPLLVTAEMAAPWVSIQHKVNTELSGKQTVRFL